MPVWSTPGPQGDNQQCVQTWPNVPGAGPAPEDALVSPRCPVIRCFCSTTTWPPPWASTETAWASSELRRRVHVLSVRGPQPLGTGRSRPVRNWATQQEAMAGGPAKPPLCLQRLPAPGPPQLRLTPSDIRATEPWVPGATKAVARRHKLHWTMTRHAHHCGNATVTILAPTP